MERIAALGVAPDTAADIACGCGRESAWLAMQGWRVDAFDVLPDALSRVRDLAGRCGVTVNTILRNLRRQPGLPESAYSLACVFRFLHRPLLPAIARAVTAGGFVIYETFCTSDATSAGRDKTHAIGIGAGELAAAFAGFEVIIARDDVERHGRRFSQLLARRT